MHKISVTFILLSSCFGIVTSTGAVGFIIGGGDASVGEFPYMTVVLRNGLFVCGGTLLTPRTVLTAYHCTLPHQFSFSVRLGEHNRTKNESTEQTIAVSEIRPHPTADLAILVLEKPAILNEWVNTAEFVEKDPILGYPAVAIGWGWTKPETSSISSVLQKVILPIQSNKACVDDGLAWIDDKTQLCAGFTIFRKYVNVCHRDSGSPLIVTDPSGGSPKVVGVVKGGHPGCAADKHMAVFTRITPFKQWIQDNMQIADEENSNTIIIDSE